MSDSNFSMGLKCSFLGESDGFGGGENVPPAPLVKLLDALFIQAAEASEHAELGIGHLNEEKIHHCSLADSDLRQIDIRN